MKFLLSLAILTGLTLASCKKKSDSSPENESPSTTGTSTTGGTTTGGPNNSSDPILINNATMFDGILGVGTLTDVSNGKTTVHVSASAYFFPKPVPRITGDVIGVKNVFLNGDSLWCGNFPGPFLACDPTYTNGCKWKVEGLNGFPTFSMNADFPEPAPGDLSLLPVIISKSAGYSFTLPIGHSRISGIFLEDGSGKGTPNITFTLTEGTNTINLTPERLKGFPVTKYGAFIMELVNHRDYLIGGKVISFRKQIIINKEVEVID